MNDVPDVQVVTSVTTAQGEFFGDSIEEALTKAQEAASKIDEQA